MLLLLLLPALFQASSLAQGEPGVSVGKMASGGVRAFLPGADHHHDGLGRAAGQARVGKSLLTSPSWIVSGETTDNYFGESVGTAGDINGDGYADVIVGAAGHDFNTGRAYVYYGDGGGLSFSPAFTLSGETADNRFGVSVGTAGDVNDDDYADVIVGAESHNSGTGRAYVYYGGEDGLSGSPAITLSGEATDNYFGYAAGTAGDVNDDGYADIIISADGYNSNTGRAYIYMGGVAGLSASPAVTLSGETVADRFGGSVDTAGDVNGDGYADVIVGAFGHNSNTGRVYVYAGGEGGLSSSPTFTFSGETTNNYFGRAVGTAGDVNGDGYADVIVGAFGHNSNTGRAYVYTGGEGGLSSSPTFTFSGGTSGDYFGISVGTIGDANGDGYADVIVGAAGHDSYTGRAYIYTGGEGGLSFSPALTLSGETTDSRFGYAVSMAGDVNGDVYTDVIVGAWRYNSGTGRAYAYYGGRGFATLPTIETVNPVSGASDVPRNAPIVVSFSEAVDTGSISYLITPAVTGLAETWEDGDTRLTLTHDEWVASTRYTATISAGSDLDSNPLDNTPYTWVFTTSAASAPEADLALGKTRAGVGDVTAGERITYTLTIANAGPTTPVTATVIDAWSPVAAVVNVHAPGCDVNLVGGIVTCTLTSITSASPAHLMLAVTTSSAYSGTLNNSASVAPTGGVVDLIPSNDVAGPVVVTVTIGTGAPGDVYEDDDTCGAAKTVATDGIVQTHTFHDQGDNDWVKFDALAGKTYVVQVDNVGAGVDAVISLYDVCDDSPLAYGGNAFGPTVRMEWDCTADGEYYLRLQNDSSVYGEDTYDLSLTVDVEAPSAPRSVRAAPANEGLVVQWRRSPERDVAGYIVRWGMHSGGPYGNVDGVDGEENTYYQISGLDNGTAYYVVVQARDFSGNESDYSWEVGEIPSPSADDTQPSVLISRPSADPVYTTTVDSLSIRGNCADSGDNLSRVQVRNVSNGAEGWDYSLSGSADVFNVESVPLRIGDNQIQVTVYDAVGNTGSAALTIYRLVGQNGAVVIVGGHDDTYELQTRIDYATRRAYNVFRDAGFGAEDIFFLSPSPQDADEDGFSDVISTTTPANVHAILQRAASRVGPGVPFYLYMMDHGKIEVFCADGCEASGRITPQELDDWLGELEASSNCDLVNVIIEACHSGSFVDRVDDVAQSISKAGRVVIVSTGRTSNAYASAQGAHFSDAFFSAVANSKSLLSSFEQGQIAVEVAGHYDQTPWLDDNGDGLSNPTDGTLAGERYVTSFFGSLLPEITVASVSLSGVEGTITAQVERGDAPLDLVWAAVYAPSFQEPTTTTMDLGVPLVKLEPDQEQEGVYQAIYNGFVEEGTYRVVVYVADEAGNQALPKKAFIVEMQVFLPLLLRK
jgi:hypothetical protein